MIKKKNKGGSRMDLTRLKESVDPKIWKRGHDYYLEENVREGFKEDDHTYHFIVEGTDDYEVTVTLGDGGEVIDSYCDCPYDLGPVCKHEVAVYFKLQEMEPQEKAEMPPLKDLLNQLTKEELVELIYKQAMKDKTFAAQLVKPKTSKKELKKQVTAVVKTYNRRNRILSYREVNDFVTDMMEILDDIRDVENILEGLDLEFYILQKAVEAFQYADDSGGDVGYLVKSIISQINDRVMESADYKIEVKKTILDKLMKFSEHPCFDGWDDFQLDLLEVCLVYADDQTLANQFREKLEALLGNKEVARYYHGQILELLWRIIVIHGAEQEKEVFIHQQLHFTFFRQLLIDQNLEKENYEKVLQLALEGEKQDQQLRGLVNQWKKSRYLAYKGLKQRSNQEQLARELLISGDYEYYQELKELVQDWRPFYRELMEGMRGERGIYADTIYLQIIEEENDLNELLYYVKKNPFIVERYAEKLMDTFPDEVISIYKAHIQQAAESANNRKQYKVVCNILKKYKQVAGGEKQRELILELSARYAKRPAFLEEVGKL